MRKLISISLCLMLVFVCVFSIVSKEVLAKREGKKLEIKIVADLLPWTKNNLDVNRSDELKAWEKLSNVEINYITPPHSNYGDKVNLMLATGNLPDILNYGDVAQLVSNDLLVPLTDYWDSEAAKKVIEKYYNDSSFDPVTINGEIWGIPLPKALYASEGTMVRKDWLENLGLEKPETLEEYREVLNAFTYDDPDGNGKDDTYGYTCRKGLTCAATFGGAFGIDFNKWGPMQLRYDLIDGKLVPQQTQDKYKEFLKYMRTLIYEDKVFVPDAAINTSDQWKKDMFTSRAGMWQHSTTRIDQYFMANMKKANPDWKERGIEIDYTKPPLDPADGKGLYPLGLNVQGNILITRAAKDPEAIFDYFMWALSDEEAIEFAKYGLEGKHHKVVNGKKEWKEGVFEDELQWQVKNMIYTTKFIGLDDEEVAATYGERALEAAKFNEKYNKPAKTFLLGKPMLDAEKNYLSTLNTLVEEYSLKIMLGEIEVDSGFEEMKKALNKNGLDKVVTAVQEWYDKNKK